MSFWVVKKSKTKRRRRDSWSWPPKKWSSWSVLVRDVFSAVSKVKKLGLDGFKVNTHSKSNFHPFILSFSPTYFNLYNILKHILVWIWGRTATRRSGSALLAVWTHRRQQRVWHRRLWWWPSPSKTVQPLGSYATHVKMGWNMGWKSYGSKTVFCNVHLYIYIHMYIYVYTELYNNTYAVVPGTNRI